jgi:hypothetical protein
MAKELPYFRFTVQDWQNGKISLESFEMQGLFINVCGYYWINDCNLTLTMLKKKFSNVTILLEQLIELSIIKHENRHDKVEIDFLNIQYDLLSEKRKLRQSAGSKGGNAKAMLKQNSSYKDKDNNKDNNKDKFSFKNSLVEYGFNEKLVVDWMLVRKNKKSTNSQTAYKLFIEEIEKRNCDLNKILELIVSKSWAGFKWEWVDKEKPINDTSKLQVFFDINQQLKDEYDAAHGIGKE